MARAFIYCITNRVNGKRYIGIARNPELRWRQHCSKARGAPTQRQRIHQAIAKHGPDAFSFEVVACSATWADGLATEILLIKALATRDAGYNRTDGGDGVVGLIISAKNRAKTSARMRLRKFTEAHLAALRLAMKGRKPTAAVIEAGIAANKGRKLSEATRAAMSAARIGHAVSEETRAKIRASNVGLKRSAATCEANRLGHLGIRHTPEQSAAKSARQKGRKLAPWTDARRAALSAAQKGQIRNPLSEAHKAAISAATKGRKISAATRALLRAANLGKKRPARSLDISIDL